MRRFLIGFTALIILLLMFPIYSIKAKDTYLALDIDESNKLDLFVKTPEMAERLSLLFQDSITIDDIDCSKAIKVNILPDNFTDIWTYSGDMRNIYGNTWQYKIPMVIKEKYVVITVAINDGHLEYAGASYGEEFKTFLIDENRIISELCLLKRSCVSERVMLKTKSVLLK